MVTATVVIVRPNHGDISIPCARTSRAWSIANLARNGLRSGGKYVLVMSDNQDDAPTKILANTITEVRVEQEATTSTAHDHRTAASGT